MKRTTKETFLGLLSEKEPFKIKMADLENQQLSDPTTKLYEPHKIKTRNDTDRKCYKYPYDERQKYQTIHVLGTHIKTS